MGEPWDPENIWEAIEILNLYLGIDVCLTAGTTQFQPYDERHWDIEPMDSRAWYLVRTALRHLQYASKAEVEHALDVLAGEAKPEDAPKLGKHDGPPYVERLATNYLRVMDQYCSQRPLLKGIKKK